MPPRPPRRPRPERRADIRLEAALIGGLGLAVAVIGWTLLARGLGGTACGPRCSAWSREVVQIVLWLVVALSGTLAAAAAYVVSAVARLLDAEPAQPPASLSAASATD